MSHEAVARVDQLTAEARDIVDRLLEVVDQHRASGKDDSEVFAELGHEVIEERYCSSQFGDEDDADMAYLQLFVYAVMRLARRESPEVPVDYS